MAPRRSEVLLGGAIIGMCLLLWHMDYLPKLGNNSVPVVSNEVKVKSDGTFDIQSLDQKDKDLIYYVRSHYIFLPSVLEYSFGKKKVLTFYDKTVDNVIYPMFKNKTEGFFVEVGAYNGIASHTLILEREYKWNGLLIECNPELIPKLKAVNRKAYISDVCLSTSSHPVKTRMTSMDKWLASSSLGSGNLYPSWIKSNFTTFEVQTIPVYSIIASIDVTEVDLFILDIQSLELDVLKHFPFDLVLVKVWVIEVYFFSKDQRNGLAKFMASKGYPEKRAIRQSNDYIFIHETFE